MKADHLLAVEERASSPQVPKFRDQLHCNYPQIDRVDPPTTPEAGDPHPPDAYMIENRVGAVGLPLDLQHRWAHTCRL